MKLKICTITMLICLFVVVGAAWAVPFPVDLNYSNTAGDTGITYATVYGTIINTTTFQFDVKVSDGFLMRNFYFNTDIIGLTASNISLITPIDYTATVNYDSLVADGFGKFDISVDTTGQHDVTELIFSITGLAAGTWTGADFYLMSFTNSGNPPGNGYAHFAAQIAPTGSGVTTFFARDGGTPKVPEPNTMLLLGSGLLGLALYRKRKAGK